MDEILMQVREYTDRAHGDQVRKYSPERYIVHPVRVMEICREYTNDIATLCAALLHDVIEDTPVTKQSLDEFLYGILDTDTARKTSQLVEELTDVYIKRDFPSWNRRKRKSKETERIKNTSSDAQTIKYADIIDNCPELTDNDPDFAQRFLKECQHLLIKMQRGNRQLHQRAFKTVTDCLTRLQENKKKFRSDLNAYHEASKNNYTV